MTTLAKKISLLVTCYILFIAAVMHNGRLGPDTYSYWQWSRHLDWSYYDGPPMIAYTLRIITTLFGNSETSILLLGFLAIAFTSYFLYQAAEHLFKNEKIAAMSVYIWLSTAGVLRHFCLLVTYDTLLIIFWAATFYYFLRLLHTKKIRYYYFTGISIGLMLLTKYTGILLCVSLFIVCLVYPKYRFVLKNKHFYIALCVALFLFSPVLYWNYLHHFASFAYQLHHGFHKNIAGFSGVILYFKKSIMDFNIFFFIFIFILGRYGKTILKNDTLGLIAIPTILVWSFFLISSLKSMPGDSWYSECFFTATLLLAYYIIHFSLKPLIFALSITVTIIYLVISRAPMLNPLPNAGWSNVYATKNMLDKIPLQLYQNKIIYCNDYYWLSAFIGYFLPTHPRIYSTHLENGRQYYYWNKMEHPAKTGDTVLLFSYYPDITDKHFAQCKLQLHEHTIQKNIFHGVHRWELYVYYCKYKERGVMQSISHSHCLYRIPH